MHINCGLTAVNRLFARIARGRAATLIIGAIAIGYGFNPGVGLAAEKDPILSEVRLGALRHDAGVFGRREETGADGNIEVLFGSPEILAAIWSPRPHLGLTVNSDGGTSQAYFGLTWDYDFAGMFFVEGSLGAAVHDGETDYEFRDQKALGCRILFREQVSVGIRFRERHSLSLMLDHVSNASLCRGNEGLDNIGIRYGYKY